MKRKIPVKKKIIYIFDKSKYTYFPMFKRHIYKRTFRENFLLAHWMFHKNYLIKNFNWYSYFLKNFKKTQQLYLYRNFIKNFYNFLIMLPLFSFKKQLFIKNIFFFDLMVNNNINTFFVFNNFLKLNYKFNAQSNLKNLLFSYSYFVMNLNNQQIEYIQKLENDENLKNLFKIKYIFQKNNNNDLSQMITVNYNCHILNIFEIYKILQNIYLYKIIL